MRYFEPLRDFRWHYLGRRSRRVVECSPYYPAPPSAERLREAALASRAVFLLLARCRLETVTCVSVIGSPSRPSDAAIACARARKRSGSMECPVMGIRASDRKGQFAGGCAFRVFATMQIGYADAGKAGRAAIGPGRLSYRVRSRWRTARMIVPDCRKWPRPSP